MKNKTDISFLGIGAAKSGTTWLANCMREHPQIFIPHRKEVCFFDWIGSHSNYNKGLPWYDKFFQNASLDTVKGEFTNQYMFLKDSHSLIKNTYPNVKLIACLRNPIDLAYSLYWWKKSNYESGKIEDTFEKEIEKDTQYIERGLFYKQLKPYFDNFPRENIKIIMYDDIQNNPSEVLKDVFEFLKVRPNFIPTQLNKRVNKTKKVRYEFIADIARQSLELITKLGFHSQVRAITSNRYLADFYTKVNKKDFTYPKMKKLTREKLRVIFEEDNRMLATLLNQELAQWK